MAKESLEKSLFEKIIQYAIDGIALFIVLSTVFYLAFSGSRSKITGSVDPLVETAAKNQETIAPTPIAAISDEKTTDKSLWSKIFPDPQKPKVSEQTFHSESNSLWESILVTDKDMLAPSESTLQSVAEQIAPVVKNAVDSVGSVISSIVEEQSDKPQNIEVEANAQSKLGEPDLTTPPTPVHKVGESLAQNNQKEMFSRLLQQILAKKAEDFEPESEFGRAVDLIVNHVLLDQIEPVHADPISTEADFDEPADGKITSKILKTDESKPEKKSESWLSNILANSDEQIAEKAQAPEWLKRFASQLFADDNVNAVPPKLKTSPSKTTKPELLSKWNILADIQKVLAKSENEASPSVPKELKVLQDFLENILATDNSKTSEVPAKVKAEVQKDIQKEIVAKDDSSGNNNIGQTKKAKIAANLPALRNLVSIYVAIKKLNDPSVKDLESYLLGLILRNMPRDQDMPKHPDDKIEKLKRLLNALPAKQKLSAKKALNKPKFKKDFQKSIFNWKITNLLHNVNDLLGKVDILNHQPMEIKDGEGIDVSSVAHQSLNSLTQMASKFLN